MYVFVLTSIWFAVSVIAYWLAIVLRRSKKQINIAVCMLTATALVWAALSTLSANSFHGPMPKGGWSSVEQVARNWFITPGGGPRSISSALGGMPVCIGPFLFVTTLVAHGYRG